MVCVNIKFQKNRCKSALFLNISLLLIAQSCKSRAFNQNPSAAVKSNKSNCSDSLINLEKLPLRAKFEVASVENCSAIQMAESMVKRRAALGVTNDTVSKKELFKGSEFLFSQNTIPMLFFKSSSLNSILKDGFLNQYQTNTSAGTLNFDKRFETESALMGLEFSAQSDSQKEYLNFLLPKYSYLAMKFGKEKEKKFFIDGYSEQYGNVGAVLKPEVMARSTWTLSDSLQSYFRAKEPSPFDKDVFAKIFHIYTFLKQPTVELKMSGGYMEAQTWGPLTKDDIHYFVLSSGAAKDKQTLKEFSETKIPLYKIDFKYHLPNQKIINTEEEEINLIDLVAIETSN